MKRALLCLGLAAGLQAGAAEAPEAELFGGYGLVKADEESLHGWAAGAAFRLRGPLSLAVDASQHWGGEGDVSTGRLLAAAGPSLSLLRRGRLALEAHVLAGVARDTAGLEVYGVSISESATAFAVLAGGSLDVGLGGRFALRAARVDYVGVDRDGEWRSDLRFAAGLLFRP